MRKFILVAVLTGVMGMTCAGELPPPLNQVVLQLSAEKWATTKTARVVVSVNAVLKADALDSFRSSLLTNLAKLSDVEPWHIIQFNRMQDQSGLEKLQVTAESRLPDKVLANLRQAAKEISKPGEQYTITDIQFTPSLAEVEQTKNDVRNEIYAAANAELARLNKQYPDSHFVINYVNFLNTLPPGPLNRNDMPVNAVGLNMASVESSNNLNVSDKISMNAMVVFASLLK